MKIIELDDELFEYLLEEEIQLNLWEAEQALESEKPISFDPSYRERLSYMLKRKNCLERFLAILKAAE